MLVKQLSRSTFFARHNCLTLQVAQANFRRVAQVICWIEIISILGNYLAQQSRAGNLLNLLRV